MAPSLLKTRPDAARLFGTLTARTATGALVTALVTGGVFYAPDWLFTLGTCAFICFALWELFTMLRSRGSEVHRSFGVAVGAVIPLVVGFQLGQGRSGEVLFIVLACFFLFLFQFLRKDDPRSLEGISLTLFGIMYVSWFMSFILKIRMLEFGPLWIGYLVLVTKGSDIGAYLGGSLFGRHTLVPHISPKKSVEGTAAGLAASVALSLLFYDILPFKFSWIQLAVMGLLTGVVGQCGDLSESLIKRYCGVKDSGSRLPGFGGFLDIMDSVLFTTPLLYFFILTLERV